MRRGRLLAAGAGLGVGLLLGPPAAAGIYKCTGADGSVHYTSDPSHCENAEPQVLKKDLQRVLSDESPRRTTRAQRPAARGGMRDGHEAMWRRKRPEAQQELVKLEQRLARMKGVVRSCNRGGQWYRTTESGIREHIACDDLNGEYTKLQQEHERLVHYLAEGLEDECRRAGCQPGWVR